MKISILRVLGIRSSTPAILARVDEHRVDWNPHRGWTCTCDTEGDECAHVDAIADLIDPRVVKAPCLERTSA